MPTKCNSEPLQFSGVNGAGGRGIRRRDADLLGRGTTAQAGGQGDWAGQTAGELF